MSEITINASEIDNLQIPELEKTNLHNLFNLLMKIATKNGDKIKLDIVGGVLNKSWPRKDIDVVIKMEQENGSSELDKAEKSFNKLVQFTHQVENDSNGFFQLGRKHPPYPSSQFDSDNINILEHNGSLEINPQLGTTIELIRRSDNE